MNVGKLLRAVDDLGIANDTLLIFSTDNGPNQFSWPDAATTPFRSEKDTNWEGAFRVPAVIRWPGHVKPGSISNDMVSGLDWFPTILAAAGDTTIKVLQPAHGSGERADIVSDQYYWVGKNAYMVQWSLYKVVPFIQSLKEYPPSQRVGSFSIDQMLEALSKAVESSK